MYAPALAVGQRSGSVNHLIERVRVALRNDPR
jgi:hypothetical protein